MRGLLLCLALFLTLGNTLKLVNHSKSVFEFTQYASHPIKHADSNPVKGIHGAKFIEISEVEAEAENEDQLHDLHGCLAEIVIQSSSFPSNLIDKTVDFDKDIPSLPLFLLYCQRKSYLG